MVNSGFTSGNKVLGFVIREELTAGRVGVPVHFTHEIRENGAGPTRVGEQQLLEFAGAQQDSQGFQQHGRLDIASQKPRCKALGDDVAEATCGHGGEST